MTTKIRRQAIALIREDKLNSSQIAKIVGCHSGYVRAIKQQQLHPEREMARERARIQTRSRDPEEMRLRSMAYRRRRKAMRVSELT